MNEANAFGSMTKSMFVAASGAFLLMLLAFAASAYGAGTPVSWLAVPSFIAAAPLVLLASGGWLTLQRQRRIMAGEPDLFLACNKGRSERAVLDGTVPNWSRARRQLARRLFGHGLMVGDSVRIKPLSEIRATLDAESCLHGIPFMHEMERFCGQSVQVYRLLDKIYDYGRSRLMRRLDGCVLLAGLRCDGGAHGSCDAACYLIWRVEWLEVAPTSHRVETATSAADGREPDPPQGTYSCQYTRLTGASRPLGKGFVRARLGPLAAGNVTLSAFVVSQLTALFNAFQNRRGGALYPWKPGTGAPAGPLLTTGESLAPGEWVRVRTPAEISRTLDRNSKNRGLWFDADMLKYCGQRFRVRGRIEKIIDIKSGALVSMKTPCFVLEDVDYSGEFQGFGEQHDYLYWRAAWLERLAPAERRAT